MQNNQYFAQPYDPYGYNVPQNNIVRPNIGGQQIVGTAFGHQVQRGIPRFLSDSAKKKGLISVGFFANGLAGNERSQIVLNLASAPLSMVWALGVLGKNGEVVEQGGGMVPGSVFDSGTVLNGMSIFSGANADYCCDKNNLTVKITSTNVGWPDFLTAYFYYMTFYDDPEIATYGL